MSALTQLWNRYHRWLYEGGRPNRLARFLNRLGALPSSSGLTPRNWATLEVRGRRTGRRTSFPVAVADHDGERYLVSMLGEDANWVRNVRADGGRAVLVHGGREDVRLVDVEPGLRAPILRRYLAVAPGARPHIPVNWHAPLPAFEAVAADYPVFHVQAEGSH